jgi:putative transposase
MARANRHYLPGYIWHITHRCHKREFLFKFNKDKRIWLKWLFEAKKRFGLCILNYCVTSNHVHLLVRDEKKDVISKSIQLIAGRVGREYNQRKSRKGAFWEDRYHATAIKNGDHLIQCMVYIDLNMIRAGVVQHPVQWMFGGYHEIQKPKQRYSLINRQRLSELLGIKDSQFPEYHYKWIDERIKSSSNKRDGKWTESIAVGDKDFILKTKAKLGANGIGQKAFENNSGYELKETQESYSRLLNPENDRLRPNNTYSWNVFL